MRSKCQNCFRSKIQLTGDFGDVSIFQCDHCGLAFSSKLSKNFDPRHVYNNYYVNEIPGRFVFGIEYLIRLFRFFRAFKVWTACSKAKRILDIGSGRGLMLYYLRKYYGYTRTSGTQIENNAYEFSKNKLGLEIYNDDLLNIDLGPGDFDIITLWHVLEHLAKPSQYFKKIRSLLREKGCLVIEVPNFDSWTRKLTGRYWLGLDPQYHLFFFTPKSLVGLLTKYGFKTRKIRTFSLEYSAFISAQSLISWLTKTDQLFFLWLQRGGFKPVIAFHLLLFLVFLPFSLLINLFFYFSKRGEVLVVVAQK